ncbi:MAG: lamin tail domain-containing protein [Candidatus Pacebacteria bacterium]|nr:lamin tail domain-containing protein [Candidatus Paceibacterota bacterium]
MKRGHVAHYSIAACLLLSPGFASAQVVINEVMYNPQGSDAGREWIELYNQGAADVTMLGGSGKGSWRINDGSNHTFTDPGGGTGRGSLTIPAGGYLMIASDPNEFISGEYAGGSYSVVKSSLSLSNNGAGITLLDGSGATLDTVAYSPTQGGTDDGSSLQRQTDGSWIAAAPTPGTTNSSTRFVAPIRADPAAASQTQSSSTDSSAAITQPAISSYVPPPAPSLYADAGGDKTVIVGADVEFDASAYDKSQTLLDSSVVRYMWNFGDGATAEGEAVLHHFEYPGTYAVTLEIANNKNAAGAQITVTANPAALSFSLLQDGGVQIQNLDGRDIDLSQWIVHESDSPYAAQLIIPQSSKILSGSSMQISPQTLGFRASSSTMLEYPNGLFALAMGTSSIASAEISSEQVSQVQKSIVPIPSVSAKSKATHSREKSPKSAVSIPSVTQESAEDSGNTDEQIATASDPVIDAVQTDATETVLQTASAASANSSYLWWTGIIAIALAAGAALAAAGYYKKGEWDIVEDTSE